MAMLQGSMISTSVKMVERVGRCLSTILWALVEGLDTSENSKGDTWPTDISESRARSTTFAVFKRYNVRPQFDLMGLISGLVLGVVGLQIQVGYSPGSKALDQKPLCLLT